MKKNVLFLACCALSPVAFGNGANEVPLTDDTMIAMQSSEKFGVSEFLNIGGGFSSYLKFSLDTQDSTLTTEYQANPILFVSNIEKAILTVFVTKTSGTGEVTVNQVTNDWNEETLNDQNKPSIILAGQARTLVPSKFVSFDVTDMAIGARSSGDQHISFVISSDSEEVAVIDSKENEATSHFARLFIREKPIAGKDGRDGAAAAKGDKGDPGEKGEKGDKGDAGPAGEQGIAGPVGPKGKDGSPGPQGRQGPQGEQGPTGNQGPQGPEGPQGPKGDKGDKGDPGKDGTCHKYCK